MRDSIVPDSLVSNAPRVEPERGGWLVWTAFSILVLLVSANVVAISIANQELPPFLAAGIRVAAASLLFLGYVGFKGIALPRGRALAGVLLFGFLQYGLGFGLIYWALQEVPAGLAAVILALVPLFTLLFASLAGQERLRFQSLVGSLVAFAGIAVMFGERVGRSVPNAYLLAVVVTAGCFALAPVVFKAGPTIHLAAVNGLGMLLGSAVMLGAAFAFGERLDVPGEVSTWAAMLYLILPGSVGVFALLLFVLNRWTASRLSYQAVISPVVSILLAAWLLDEPFTRGLFLGAALVTVGVYFGAISQNRRPFHRPDRWRIQFP